MATTNVYLNFNGDCEEAFNFYKSAFGGEFTAFSRFSEMPESEDYTVSETDKERIMHVSFPIGNSVLMGSDIGSNMSPEFIQGNNFSVGITANSKEEADTLFSKLSEGGLVTMPIGDTFWGDYFGMFNDKFGISWLVSYNEQEQNA